MINYFDIGSNIGVTIELMLDVFNRLGIDDFMVYGLEPTERAYNHCVKQFESESRVKMFKVAIADKAGKVNLYHSAGIGDGNSIFKTKYNVKPNDFETVKTVKFSDFIAKEVPGYKKAFNILQANIEGAEWYLFNDIVESGVSKYIHLYAGEGCPYPIDLLKVTELGPDKYNRLGLLMNNNDIVLHRFVRYKPERNEDMGKLVTEMLKNGGRNVRLGKNA